MRKEFEIVTLPFFAAKFRTDSVIIPARRIVGLNEKFDRIRRHVCHLTIIGKVKLECRLNVVAVGKASQPLGLRYDGATT